MKRNAGMKEGSVYELDGRVPLKKALPLGIQHVLAMFLGNVSPLLIVCGLLDIALDMKTVLIQNAMFVAAIATLLQLYPIRRFGSRLPIVMGTSSGFIGTAQIIGSAFGYGALMGASMVGSLFEMVLLYPAAAQAVSADRHFAGDRDDGADAVAGRHQLSRRRCRRGGFWQPAASGRWFLRHAGDPDRQADEGFHQ